MFRTLMRVVMMSVLLFVIGGVGPVDVLQAKPNNKRPPQVLPSGFESSDSLLRDVERAERAPLHSAWIVESSRFLNVPFGGFQPDKAGLNTTVDLPVNVGIIEDPQGN